MMYSLYIISYLLMYIHLVLSQCPCWDTVGSGSNVCKFRPIGVTGIGIREKLGTDKIREYEYHAKSDTQPVSVCASAWGPQYCFINDYESFYSNDGNANGDTGCSASSDAIIDVLMTPASEEACNLQSLYDSVPFCDSSSAKLAINSVLHDAKYEYLSNYIETSIYMFANVMVFGLIIGIMYCCCCCIRRRKKIEYSKVRPTETDMDTSAKIVVDVN